MQIVGVVGVLFSKGEVHDIALGVISYLVEGFS